MKINVAELSKLSIEDLTTQLKSNGISSNKLDKAIGASVLPEKGMFTHFTIEGTATLTDGTELSEANPETDTNKIVSDFRHIKLYADNGDSISLSRLQASGFKGEIDPEKDFKEAGESAKTPGALYLKSNFVVNPSLQGNQASILKRIIGKKFTAKPVTYDVMVYNPEGYFDLDAVVTKPQTSYQIELAK